MTLSATLATCQYSFTHTDKTRPDENATCRAHIHQLAQTPFSFVNLDQYSLAQITSLLMMEGYYSAPLNNFLANLPLKTVIFVTLGVLGCANSVLTRLSQANGAYDYNTALIPVIVEALKFSFSFCLLANDFYSSKSLDVSFYAYGIPYVMIAFLYSIQNNVTFYILQSFDPGLFQICMALKLPITAILMSRILSKQFYTQQIFSLFMVTSGCALTQYKPYTTSLLIPLKSTMLLVLVLASSSLAAVLNEKFLKTHSHGSIHWQNAQLYFFGMLFCSFNVYYGRADSISIGHFNLFSWLIILNSMIFGLFTSIALKVTDGILRSFASVLSIFLAVVLSQKSFGVQYSPLVYCGGILSAVGMIVYAM